MSRARTRVVAIGRADAHEIPRVVILFSAMKTNKRHSNPHPKPRGRRRNRGSLLSAGRAQNRRDGRAWWPRAPWGLRSRLPSGLPSRNSSICGSSVTDVPASGRYRSRVLCARWRPVSLSELALGVRSGRCQARLRRRACGILRRPQHSARSRDVRACWRDAPVLILGSRQRGPTTSGV